jgi:hypothetical protein
MNSLSFLYVLTPAVVPTSYHHQIKIVMGLLYIFLPSHTIIPTSEVVYSHEGYSVSWEVQVFNCPVQGYTTLTFLYSTSPVAPFPSYSCIFSSSSYAFYSAVILLASQRSFPETLVSGAEFNLELFFAHTGVEENYGISWRICKSRVCKLKKRFSTWDSRHSALVTSSILNSVYFITSRTQLTQYLLLNIFYLFVVYLTALSQ